MNKAKIKFTVIIFLGLLLAACSSSAPQTWLVNPKPTPGQIKLKQAILIIQQLRQDPAVHFIQVGETIQIVIANDAIFFPCSANLKAWTPALNATAGLMRQLETTSAEVAAFNNDSACTPCCTPSFTQSLSARQAQVVSEYLWSKGLDTRILYPKGYGATQPLSANPQAWVNRRVEIRFQYIPYEVGR